MASEREARIEAWLKRANTMLNEREDDEGRAGSPREVQESVLDEALALMRTAPSAASASARRAVEVPEHVVDAAKWFDQENYLVSMERHTIDKGETLARFILALRAEPSPEPQRAETGLVEELEALRKWLLENSNRYGLNVALAHVDARIAALRAEPSPEPQGREPSRLVAATLSKERIDQVRMSSPVWNASHPWPVPSDAEFDHLCDMAESVIEAKLEPRRERPAPNPFIEWRNMPPNPQWAEAGLVEAARKTVFEGLTKNHSHAKLIPSEALRAALVELHEALAAEQSREPDGPVITVESHNAQMTGLRQEISGLEHSLGQLRVALRVGRAPWNDMLDAVNRLRERAEKAEATAQMRHGALQQSRAAVGELRKRAEQAESAYKEADRALGEVIDEREAMEERVNLIAGALDLSERDREWSNVNDVGARCVERAEELVSASKQAAAERQIAQDALRAYREQVEALRGRAEKVAHRWNELRDGDDHETRIRDAVRLARDLAALPTEPDSTKADAGGVAVLRRLREWGESWACKPICEQSTKLWNAIPIVEHTAEIDHLLAEAESQLGESPDHFRDATKKVEGDPDGPARPMPTETFSEDEGETDKMTREEIDNAVKFVRRAVAGTDREMLPKAREDEPEGEGDDSWRLVLSGWLKRHNDGFPSGRKTLADLCAVLAKRALEGR